MILLDTDDPPISAGSVVKVESLLDSMVPRDPVNRTVSMTKNGPKRGPSQATND